VGTAIAGRNQTETEGLIGFFINTLVMRTQMSGKERFRGLLKQVREVALGAYAHQDLPFEKLVEELQPERSLNHAPLIQVAFGVQNAPVEALELPGLRLEPLLVTSENVRFDLTVWIAEDNEEMHDVWTYRTELFEDATIKRMHGHFITLLQNIVEQVDARLNELEILSEDEKRQQELKAQERAKSKYNKFVSTKPKALSVPRDTKTTGDTTPRPAVSLSMQATTDADDSQHFE
jgi:non-ribosomal peptide synthetase component F